MRKHTRIIRPMRASADSFTRRMPRRESVDLSFEMEHMYSVYVQWISQTEVRKQRYYLRGSMDQNETMPRSFCSPSRSENR